MSKDCVLVARHKAWLSDSTNIAAVAQTNAQVAARKRTVPGVKVDVDYSVAAYGGPAQHLSDLADPTNSKSVLKSLIVDGEDHTGDWSISDFTAAELKQWLAGTTYDARDERPGELNGKLPTLTMQEIIDIAKAKSATTGRTITVYPEVKNPYWNNAQARANGCGSGAHPFEDALLKLVRDNNLNSKTAPIFVQSFDPASLKYLRAAGLATRVVQLIDGNDINFQTGEMLTPAGLAEIKTYADGIGPWKPQVMAHRIVPFRQTNANGTPYTGTLAEVNTVSPTSVIADAHKAGLFVHVFTFRNERKYLAGVYQGDPAQEYLAYYRAGVDGVFTDFTPTAVAARAAYLRETGR